MLGRDFTSLKTALTALSKGQKLSTESFAVDMHEGFFSVIKQECPNAEICVDRFQLVQKVNETFAKVRRSEFKLATESKDQFGEQNQMANRQWLVIASESSRTGLRPTTKRPAFLTALSGIMSPKRDSGP